MKSNRYYYLFFKYGFLIFGLLFILVPIVSLVSPELVEFNGKAGSLDLSSAAVFILIGAVTIFIFFAIKGKFKIVELNRQQVIVFVNGGNRQYEWVEIDKLNQIQFIYPPLYKINFKNGDQPILFNTSSSYVSINGYTTDISEMGTLIKQKKQELGI